MNMKAALERDAQDLRNLADRISEVTHDTQVGLGLLAGIAICGDRYQDIERRLDSAAWSLRKRWLELAHRPADATPKSPCAGQHTHVAAGADIEFGYERELDASILEGRREGYMPRHAGWSEDLVLFRSGQAALSSLLLWAHSNFANREPLRVAHRGAYFETRTLLEALEPRLASDSEDPHIVISEPVWCDGQFGVPGEGPCPRDAMLVDTTLVGPDFDVAPYLDARADVVVAFSSGLKLDQAGLELANVGIVRIYARRDASAIASDLRRLRGLTGTGLTLDELSALSAPWFMEGEYASRYTAAVFAHNRALAEAVGTESPVFRPLCHPSVAVRDAEAPFCALELHEASPERYRSLVERIEVEVVRRELLVVRGGSFGFRGHRYELIEPAPGQGRSFLRVALGWRDGHSRQGLCELFADLARRPL